ncbi:MAG TPA: aldehyde dehydrogenase family protein, partial [Chloroflexota bacterium]
MVTAPGDQKITYTTMSVDQSEAFNLAYESALSEVMSQLGKDYPAYIGGKPRTVALPRFEDRSPADANLLVGRFEECGQAEADASVAAAQSAFQSWSHTRWQERVAILRNAADIIRERKFEMSAWLTVEAGKPRLEAMGEVEEAADLIEIYCSQMEQHKGYVIRLNQLSPQEVNHSVLRPYGVWAVISPFNFPVALLTGMIAGALVAGNTVVFKPSENTPLSGLNVYGCLRDAGIPDGAVNVVTGRGNDIGEALSG